MPVTVTQAQITGAADALAVSRLQTTIQLEQAKTYEAEIVKADAERVAAAQRFTDSKALQERQAAAVERAASAAEAAVALQQQVAADLLNRDQELFLSLYQMHLKTRLGPSVISSATADTVMTDIVTDAHRMTETIYPAMRASLDKLATPQV